MSTRGSTARDSILPTVAWGTPAADARARWLMPDRRRAAFSMLAAFIAVMIARMLSRQRPIDGCADALGWRMIRIGDSAIRMSKEVQTVPIIHVDLPTCAEHA